MFWQKPVKQVVEQSKTNKTKENLTIRDLLNGTVSGWRSKFLTNIYKDTTMYPHEEMLRATKSYRTNSLIYAAANTMRDFIVGGDYKITADDKNSQDFLNNFFEQSNLKNYVPDIVLDLINAGNSYLERINSSLKTLPYVYSYIPTPERMYIDYDFDKDRIKRYVQEIPAETIPNPQIKQITINYFGNNKKSIKGIEIPTNKIWHFKMGISTIPIYGRGAVCVVSNDVEVVKEIERAMAVISRYKAIPKKIISLQDDNPRVVDKFKEQINRLEDQENPITNVPVDIKDLTDTNGTITFQPILDYLKRKLTIALAPEYIIHGEDTNRATSKEQRIGFLLRIKSIRDQISTIIEEEFKRVLQMYGYSTDGVKFEFGSFDIGEAQENQNSALQGWNSGLLTLKEARTLYGIEQPTDYDQYFKWELISTPSTNITSNETNPNNQGAEEEPNINK